MTITTDNPRCLYLNWPEDSPLPEGARVWATEREADRYLNSLARQPVPQAPAWSKDDYDEALLAAIDSRITAMPADYRDLSEVSAFALFPGPYQEEAQAILVWYGLVWEKSDHFPGPEFTSPQARAEQILTWLPFPTKPQQ